MTSAAAARAAAAAARAAAQRFTARGISYGESDDPAKSTYSFFAFFSASSCPCKHTARTHVGTPDCVRRACFNRQEAAWLAYAACTAARQQRQQGERLAAAVHALNTFQEKSRGGTNDGDGSMSCHADSTRISASHTCRR